MFIHRIALKNFRKFTDKVEVGSIGDGLTVIVGDNEEGKSTLLKAVQTSLFDRAKLTGQGRDQMTPYGAQVNPELEVDFSLDDETYQLRKVFANQQGSALLKCTRGGPWQNDAADEQLQELLKYTPRGRGESSNENRGLAGLLWIEQGRAFTTLDPNRDSKDAISSAIEGEVGHVLGGERGRRLLDAVSNQLERYFTPTGQKKAALKAPASQLDDLCARHDSVCANLKEHEDKVDRLGTSRRTIRDIEEGGVLAMAEAALTQASAQQAQLGALEQSLKEVDNHFKTAQREEERVRSEMEQRARLARQIEQIGLGLASREDDERTLGGDVARLADTLHQRETDRERLRSERNELREVLRSARESLDSAVASERLQELEALIAEADASERKILEFEFELKGHSIDAKVLKELQRLSDAVTIARAALEAVSVQLSFAPDGCKSVKLAGSMVSEESITVSERVTLAFEGFGDVTVAPGAGELTTRRDVFIKAQSALDEEFTAHGVESLGDAQASHDQRSDLANRVRILKEQIERAPRSLADVRREAASLREQIGQLPGHAGKETGAVDARRAHLTAAEENLGRAEKAFAAAELAHAGAMKEWQGLWDELNQLKHDLASERSKRATLEDQLIAKREILSDGDLDRQTDVAEVERANSERRLRELEQELSGINRIAIEGELERARDAVEQTRRIISDTDREILKLEAALGEAGQQGLGEEREELEGLIEVQAAEVARLERDARAYRLLHDTMSAAEVASKRAFLQPIISRMMPYLSLVFPGSDISIDEESFDIRGIRRNDNEESFEQLSLGTREQLAVLARLAFAELLLEKGQPVALILDDPLVNSDDGRFRGMELALRRAAKKVQIIILTCHQGRYMTIGAPMIHLSECRVEG
ncbi:AAA family ATPase [Emcibacter sp. SYSU 3D8]|uniref:AAA family ATPase n=1 Tax=Emcibacter sp. SYSU 3D8 TaxID=3133969 RepID=UPI0031FE6658